MRSAHTNAREPSLFRALRSEVLEVEFGRGWTVASGLSETSEGELASVTSDQPSQKRESRKIRGRKSYKAGYAFEDRVAEAYRLLGYKVEHGRLFGGRQVDLYLELKLADLQVRRAIECKAGGVTSDHLDKSLIKLELVKQEYPDALGAVVSGASFTNEG